MLVGSLLTVLTLAVIQLAVVLLIRNTAVDAATEGAQYAALADNELSDGIARTREIISSAIGPPFARHVTARYDNFRGARSTVITVKLPLPLLGPLGPSRGLEVTGHGAVESLAKVRRG